MDFTTLQKYLPFGGDGLYNSLIALALLVGGLAILLKAGKKWGLIVSALGIGWAAVTFANLLFG